MKLFIFICVAFLAWSAKAYKPIDGNYGLRVPLGFSLHSLPTSLKSSPYSKEVASLPKYFDARIHFTKCNDVISRIGNQGYCGSCWTFGTAFAISDRICIASNGTQKPWISTQDLIECLSDYQNNGCWGGWPTDAWNYYATYGLVTGSGSDLKEGCKPNIFSYKNIAEISFSCTMNCENSNVLKSKPENETTLQQYLKDKHFGAGLVTTISSKDSDHINKIKLEMYKNGPVTALMFVPEGKYGQEKLSFYAAKGLIYSNNAVWGPEGPNHAVRLIGWGEERGVHYWIVANSWGIEWGQNGTVKIQQGKAMIDDLIMFGMPDLSKKNEF